MRILLLGLATAFMATPASANISVNPNVTMIEADGERRRDILVTNNGAARAYVEVTPSRIDAPGTADEVRVSSPNPSDIGLLAAPRRLVIEPGATRVVRLAVLNEDVAREQVYRVLFHQASGGVESDVQAFGVAVLISFDALVVVRPYNAEADLVVSRENEAVRIRNAGNASALLTEGEACQANVCRDLGLIRLYAGADVAFDVAADETATFMVDEPGDASRRLTIRPATQ